MELSIGWTRLSAVSLLLLAAGLVATPGESQEVEFADIGMAELTRPALVALVLERNPSLESLRAAASAAAERETIESSYDDPRVITRVAPLSIDSDMGFGAMVEVEQMLPWKGRRATRAALARSEAEMRGLDLQELRVELAAEATELWTELWLAEHQLDTNGHHANLLTELRGSAEAQYVAGRASQQDLIQTEVEIAMAQEKRIRYSAARGDAMARINAMLHRAPEAPLPPLPMSSGDITATTTASDILQDVALSNRPALAAADASIRAAQAEAELANLDRKPGVALSALYDSMEGQDHQVQVGVSFTLPLQRERLAAGERRAKGEIAAAESRRDEVEDRVRLEVDIARRAVGTARDVLDLYRDHLEPAANDQFSAARAGFETGSNQFLAVLLAENNLRDVTLGAQEAEAELILANARLDRALGRIPDLEGRN